MRHFREKEMQREDEKSIRTERCVMKEGKMVGNDRERKRESEEEKRAVDRERGGLEVMDGLSRLARLSVRRPEVVKRNAEITALHRNQKYKECRICVAACEKDEKVWVLLNLA